VNFDRTLIVFSYFVLALAADSGARAGPRGESLDIYWVDVEGGAATLIVTPGGESVLLDTGNPGSRDPDRIVRVLTRQAGLRKIDHLIVTHYHSDHYGGASTLATMLPIGTLYDNGITDDMPEPAPEESYLNLACEDRRTIVPGDRVPLKSPNRGDTLDVSLVCLGARRKYVTPDGDNGPINEFCALHQPKDRDGTDNARSVVMLLKFGDFEFFDGGDLTWNEEYRLVCPQNRVGSVDVYQVTHHGLDSSNNPVALRSLRPTVAIMNNGATKGCLPEVFANLTQTESVEAIYQVHKNLRPDGAVNNVPDEYIANHEDETQCRGNFIHLSVDPSGDSYTVAIPAHGHKRKFKSK